MSRARVLDGPRDSPGETTAAGACLSVIPSRAEVRYGTMLDETEGRDEVTAEAQRRVAGRYLLLEPIGRGGMGIVWRAHDEVLDRPVAVKEVLYRPLSEADRETFNRRTMREARAAGRLDHPSVVVVHDVIEEDGRPWIVMQLVRSRSLGETLRDSGPIAPRRVALIGARVLDALRAAHAAGVLHRDVKPENVLLTEGGRVVLTDFGIATMPEEAALTATGDLSGTPAFIPPERLRGLPATPESDLWSLGATLYAAVEGRPPFDRGAPVPTMAAVLNDDPAPAVAAGPLAPLLEALLRKDPGRRITAAEAAEALDLIAAGVTPGSPRPPEGPSGPWTPVASAPSRAGAEAYAPPSTGAQAPYAEPYAPTRVQEPWAPAQTRTAGPWPAVQAPPGSATGAPERPARRRLAAVGATAVIAAGATGWYGYRQMSSPEAVPTVATSSPAAPVTTPVVVPPSVSTSTPPTSTPPTPAPPTPAPPTPTPESAVPPGWRVHEDSLGFSVALPAGSREFQRERTRVRFRLPGSPGYLLVDTTPWDEPHPLAALRHVEKEATAEGLLPGYRRVRLAGLTYRNRPAAEWEFTWRMASGRAHVVDRAFRTRSGRHFAVYWQTTDKRWKQESDYFDRFTATFRAS
ncbi:serine/threonine-protein kinase [Sphaerisporangium sp. TRM90804]|uniref:protein kinase domain-containing protein n=1 Tax=Sphaerisporangium sp. TRM90804 TaxID=3031113 RepID=UPI00244C6985|nr:serine/threonine-protein kinase [Sphaerisporangium sp. TRM90804]MDH2428595.1 protein kinase [Sphaerisporangium sp. TRM90804]